MSDNADTIRRAREIYWEGEEEEWEEEETGPGRSSLPNGQTC
jgi:hypothetical protein